MTGFLNILKVPGTSSHQVIAGLRRTLKEKRIGHAGTLDPAAAGVLPVAVGKATRVLEFIDSDKAYRAEVCLGISTNTEDSCGEITSAAEVNIEEDQIRNVFYSLVGTLEQVPPMFSAIKLGGKRLYQFARQGETVHREPRKVSIHEITPVRFYLNSDRPMVTFDVRCSKGTYVRTLCVEIGKRLGVPAHMSFLIRLEHGSFKLKDAFAIEEICDYSRTEVVSQVMIPVDYPLKHLPKVKLSDADAWKVRNGQTVEINRVETAPQSEPLISRVYDSKGFFAVAKVNVNPWRLKPLKVIVDS